MSYIYDYYEGKYVRISANDIDISNINYIFDINKYDLFIEDGNYILREKEVNNLPNSITEELFKL